MIIHILEVVVLCIERKQIVFAVQLSSVTSQGAICDSAQTICMAVKAK